MDKLLHRTLLFLRLDDRDNEGNTPGSNACSAVYYSFQEWRFVDYETKMDILEPSSNKVSFEQQGSTADGQPDEGSIPLNPVREQQVPLPEASDRVATKPHSLNELPTISTLCSDCLRRFQHLCDELSACTVEKGSQYGFDRDLSLGLMHDARSRFKAWAMSIAALHPSHFQSSLDFRLKGAAEIRQRVVKILNDLEESLLAGMSGCPFLVPNCFSHCTCMANLYSRG